MGRQWGRLKQLLETLNKERTLEIEIGSTRSHSMEKLLWKRLCSVVRQSTG